MLLCSFLHMVLFLYYVNMSAFSEFPTMISLLGFFFFKCSKLLIFLCIQYRPKKTLGLFSWEF